MTILIITHHRHSHQCNQHSKAGPYSGILFGITNTFAQIPGFLTPLLVSEMTQNVIFSANLSLNTPACITYTFSTQGSLAEWYQVFQLAGIVYLVAA